MSVFEKLLLAVNPEAACKRSYYRGVYRNMQSYSAGSRGNGKDGWTPVNATGEQTNRMDRDLVRARSRDLERNDDNYKAIMRDIVRNVCGTGIVLQAKVVNDNGEDDKKLNAQIEAAWKEWCRPENCTVRGNMAFWEVQKLCVRRKFVDGGVLILKVIKNGRFCLQLCEVDELDGSIVYNGKNKVVGGIELDEYDKAVAYHIRRQSVDGSYYCKAQRVDASRVIYITTIDRISQVREMPDVASSISKADDINQLFEAAIVKEKVQACFGMAITSEAGNVGGLGRGLNGGAGNRKTAGREYDELTPGMIMHLAPGEKAESISPSGISSTADGMIRAMQRSIGAGNGLSYEAATRDMSQTNYSSARQGMNQDKKTYQEWQKYFIEHMMRPIFEMWLDCAVMSGEIEIKDYFSNRKKYQNAVWTAPGFDWIDPLKEANANRIALESNQTTLQRICAQRGEDYRDVLAQRAAERNLLLQYGLLNENKKEEKSNA